LLAVLALLIALIINIRKRHAVVKEKSKAELYTLHKSVESQKSVLENTTVELIKSNTSFQQLLSELEALTAGLNAESKRKARSIIVDYKTQLQDKTWREFNLQFQKANNTFFTQLKAHNESLTESELRLAAMHTSGLSNKEISAITGQPLSSLHTLKSRLRKKMLVENDEELTEKLNLFSSRN